MKSRYPIAIVIAYIPIAVVERRSVATLRVQPKQDHPYMILSDADALQDSDFELFQKYLRENRVKDFPAEKARGMFLWMCRDLDNFIELACEMPPGDRAEHLAQYLLSMAHLCSRATREGGPEPTHKTQGVH